MGKRKAVDTEEIISLFNSGMSLTAIGLKLNYSHCLIKRVLTEAGISDLNQTVKGAKWRKKAFFQRGLKKSKSLF